MVNPSPKDTRPHTGPTVRQGVDCTTCGLVLPSRRTYSKEGGATFTIPATPTSIRYRKSWIQRELSASSGEKKAFPDIFHRSPGENHTGRIPTSGLPNRHVHHSIQKYSYQTDQQLRPTPTRPPGHHRHSGGHNTHTSPSRRRVSRRMQRGRAPNTSPKASRVTTLRLKLSSTSYGHGGSRANNTSRPRNH